jgi:Spy/CpxP family protein refolding chaperone
VAANLTDEQRQKLKQIEERHRRSHHGHWPHEFTPEPSLTP